MSLIVIVTSNWDNERLNQNSNMVSWEMKLKKISRIFLRWRYLQNWLIFMIKRRIKILSAKLNEIPESHPTTWGYTFPQNREIGQWSLHRPCASVRVKQTNFKHILLIIKPWTVVFKVQKGKTHKDEFRIGKRKYNAFCFIFS